MIGGRNKLGILFFSVIFYAIISSTLVTRLFQQSVPHLQNEQSQPKIVIAGNSFDEAVTTRKVSHKEFTCDNQNAPDNLPESSLIRRALHGVIIGTMKGGTQALHSMLLTHKRILSSGTGRGELHFFNRHYHKYMHSRRVVSRQDARDAFELTLKERKVIARREDGKYDIANQKNLDKFGVHSAPVYLYDGRAIPARLLCTAPWIKVIAMLRNPIERAFSHYHFIPGWDFPPYNKVRPSFSQFISDDIELLKRRGVIRDWNTTSFESFSGSHEEFQSWERYLSSRSKGPVGRGLYAIQLEIWMNEFKRYNKSIENDLLVLQSESTKRYPIEAYHEAVQFLGLEPHTPHEHMHIFTNTHHATNYTDGDHISDESYKLLYSLYEPYNDRLYNLLGKDEWAGVWND